MYRECFLCGRSAEQLDRHHLIGGCNRQISEKYNLCVDLCRRCHRWAHEDTEVYKALHVYAEKRWMEEQNATVEDFIKVFGKNYILEEDET